jgi:hypothetical protein
LQARALTRAGTPRRPLTFLRYNAEGDLLVTCAKDHTPNLWYADDGERIGTYSGHNGAVWTCDLTGAQAAQQPRRTRQAVRRGAARARTRALTAPARAGGCRSRLADDGDGVRGHDRQAVGRAHGQELLHLRL